MRRRALTTAAVMVVVGSTLVGCAGPQSTGTLTRAAAQASERARQAHGMHMWNVGAGGGTFTIPAAADYGDPMKLRLTGVSASVLEFSDLPARRGWVLATSDLVLGWDDLFDGSPPSAVLSFTASPGKAPDSVILEVTNPRYNPETAELDLNVTLIPVVAQPHPDASEPIPVEPMLPPLSFGSSSLMIDATSATPQQPPGTFSVVQSAGATGAFTYSLWPTERSLPSHWATTGFVGTWSEGVAHIEELWTGQRPSSLTEALTESPTTP